MNKKFLSAILFGALMVTSTGTFVSCKDYDDEIEGLQTQIDKLATKEDMTSQIASLQSALNSAQTEAAAAKKDAAAALAKANDSEKAAAQATLDAAAAKVEAIAAAQEEVAKVKATLEATVDSKFESVKTELANTITELTKSVEDLTGMTTSMLTGISLQAGYESDGSAYYSAYAQELKYSTIDGDNFPGDYEGEDEYTFGKDLTGAFTVKDGELVSTSTAALVRVTPSNAVITDDMLSIVNSKLEVLEGVNIETESYTGLLGRSASNGLYKIGFSLDKNADVDKFAEQTNDGAWPSNINFAIAATDKDERTITTEYNLTFSKKEVTQAATNVWTTSTIKSSVATEKTLSACTSSDDEDGYAVALDEAFAIKVASEEGVILASYVVVDYDNAALSTTDKVALKNNVDFEGVNEVSKENTFNITISGKKGVIVPLKVVYIDTLGNVDEEIVWVKAGNAINVAQTVNYVVTPTEYVATPNAYPYSTVTEFAVPAGAASYKMEIAGEEDGTYIVNNNNVLSFYEEYEEGATNTSVVITSEDIAYAQFAQTLDLQAMIDNKTYEGTIKFYDANNSYISTTKVTIKKVLPNAYSKPYQPKVNQLDAEGTLNAFMLPINSGTEGKKDLTQSFNGLVEHMIVSIAGAGDVDPDTEERVALEVTSSDNFVFSVPEELIDNETKHAVEVVYDYGFISSEKDENDDFVTVAVPVGTWNNVIFSCLAEVNTYAWATAPSLTYEQTDGKTLLANIKVTNARDGKYTTTLDKLLVALTGDDYAMINMTGAEAHLYSQTAKDGAIVEGSEDEYFSVDIQDNVTVGTGKDAKTGKGLVFTPNSAAQNPEATVYSTLIITAKDYFGHDVEIKIANVEVKKR